MSELIIKSFHIAAEEPAMLQAALNSASRWENSTLTLYPAKRGHLPATPEWCEWLLSVDSPATPMGFYIGIIQRHPGDEVETHS